MTADTCRFVWTATVFYVIGSAAPAVALGNGEWGKSIALTITALLMGALGTLAVGGALFILTDIFKAARTRIASYRNA